MKGKNPRFWDVKAWKSSATRHTVGFRMFTGFIRVWNVKLSGSSRRSTSPTFPPLLSSSRWSFVALTCCCLHLQELLGKLRRPLWFGTKRSSGEPPVIWFNGNARWKTRSILVMGWVAFSNVKTTACLAHMCPRLSPNAEYAIWSSRLHQCRFTLHTRRSRESEVVYNYLLQCISVSMQGRVGEATVAWKEAVWLKTIEAEIQVFISNKPHETLRPGWRLCDWNNIRLFFWMEEECEASHPYLTAEPWGHPACWRWRFTTMWQKWILEETSAKNSANCCICYFFTSFVFDSSNHSQNAYNCGIGMILLLRQIQRSQLPATPLGLSAKRISQFPLKGLP